MEPYGILKYPAEIHIGRNKFIGAIFCPLEHTSWQRELIKMAHWHVNIDSCTNIYLTRHFYKSVMIIDYFFN